MNDERPYANWAENIISPTGINTLSSCWYLCTTIIFRLMCNGMRQVRKFIFKFRELSVVSETAPYKRDKDALTTGT